MSRYTKIAALSGTTLAAALALTGCTGAGGSSTSSTASASQSSSSLIPISDGPTSSDSSDSSESSVSASGSTSSGSSATAAFPEFEAVKSAQPTNDDEAKEYAFEAVEEMYAITTAALQSGDPENAQELEVVTQSGMRQEQTRMIEDALGQGLTYEGGSQVELLDAVVGPAVRSDGSLLERSSVNLTVCEDNSEVVLTDKQGQPVDTGADRFPVHYDVMWDEASGRWEVNSVMVPSSDGSEGSEC